MSRRRRPTAFEVSFPEEAASFQEESTGTSDVDRKRCRDGPVLDDIRVRVFNPIYELVSLFCVIGSKTTEP